MGQYSLSVCQFLKPARTAAVKIVTGPVVANILQPETVKGWSSSVAGEERPRGRQGATDWTKQFRWISKTLPVTGRAALAGNTTGIGEAVVAEVLLTAETARVGITVGGADKKIVGSAPAGKRDNRLITVDPGQGI
jgi:hypothetical protein